jgi:Zn-finger nucleic acid-binding protein
LDPLLTSWEKLMKCPIDGSDLVMTERQGIEIDYCPKCRGVWLDRGELDKIIDRAAETTPQQPAPQQQPAFAQPAPGPFSYPERQYDPRRHGDDDDRYKHQGYRHRKRKGFLGELFDFD